jgi:hypothetical protein
LRDAQEKHNAQKQEAQEESKEEAKEESKEESKDADAGKKRSASDLVKEITKSQSWR